MNPTYIFRALFSKIKYKIWERQKQQQLLDWALRRHGTVAQANTPAFAQHIFFVCEEFFHPDLRGYGGFGRAVKNVTDKLRSNTDGLKCALAYPLAVSSIQQPVSKIYHSVPVVMRPYENPPNTTTLDHYADLLVNLEPRVLMSIDWHPSYEVPVHALPDTPLIIWVRDPRDRVEWEKIAAVPDELRFRNVSSAAELVALARDKELSIKRLFTLQRKVPRKIVFAVKARSLIPRAEQTYGIDLSAAHLLPTPIDIPALDTIEKTERPSLLFLGRLDAVKRPWIAFELARRHPEVDFLIAGKAHNTELMEPWLARYGHLSNLMLLGHVDGEEKDRLLRTCWGLLNTSVHEAEPVSFLEAFSYSKCVVTCSEPESETSCFVYFTGEIPGEGLDEDSLQKFDREIDSLIKNEEERLLKGKHAREKMIETHSFQVFVNSFHDILKAEGI